MIRTVSSLTLLLALTATGAQAQGGAKAGAEGPALKTSPAEAPAINPSAAPAPAAKPASTGIKPAGDGTTIIGDRESPIGLYITPWRNASAEVDIDRPARLLSLDLDPIDKRVFARQVEYYEALSAAQKARTAPAAVAPVSKAVATPTP